MSRLNDQQNSCRVKRQLASDIASRADASISFQVTIDHFALIELTLPRKPFVDENTASHSESNRADHTID